MPQRPISLDFSIPFGQYLKEQVCKSSYKTHEAFAEDIGVSQNHLFKMYAGSTLPSLATFARMVKALPKVPWAKILAASV
jgi:predicted transcriptional regulator